MFTNLSTAKKMIEDDRLLHIAADETLLKQLPRGKWIGGTTPYFITNEGGVNTKDKLFVTELDFASNCKVYTYDKNTIAGIADDTYPHGLTFLIVPFASEAASAYCKAAPWIEKPLFSPIAGWVCGFDLETGRTARVYDGFSGISLSDRAIALHLEMPKNKLASIGIVNIFEEDTNNDVIEFPNNTLEVTNCFINGNKASFADYIRKNKINILLPLQSSYNGVFINVSIKEVADDGTVYLYAPVFSSEKYRFAGNVSDYGRAFASKIEGHNAKQPVFSCNCILNYLYGDLEGSSTPPYEGPVTFGEIAYQLLNQTLVYVELLDR